MSVSYDKAVKIKEYCDQVLTGKVFQSTLGRLRVNRIVIVTLTLTDDEGLIIGYEVMANVGIAMSGAMRVEEFMSILIPPLNLPEALL